jgi:hypothetical protein
MQPQINMQETKKYQMTNEVVHNLITFLDRIQLQGLKEVAALNAIMAALNNPIPEEQQPEQK